MELKKSNKLTSLRNNKTYEVVTNVLFPICLILMCFFKVNRGIDISDSTYSPTNYLFLDNLDGMWYFSTFYANLVGGLLVKLPFGATLLGLNVYTSFFKCALTLSAYYFFANQVEMHKEIAFIGSLLSVSLCWCPTTILYNYLTYLLFVLGAILLYEGIVRERNALLFLAGIVLGSNLFIRLPNLAEAALILALWFYSFINHERFIVCAKKTLVCIAGYLSAIVIGCIFVISTRGISAYITGIIELFAMTSEASGYSSLGMILGILRAYWATLTWALPVMTALGLALLINYFKPAKWHIFDKVVYIIITLTLLFVLYKQGMFYHNFHTFESVYRLAAWMIIFAIVFDFAVIFFDTSSKDTLLAIISLIFIGITPLGSNNDLYANINNLFWIAPVFIYFLFKFAITCYYAKGMCYVIVGMTSLLIFYSVLFGFSYTFRDGAEEPLNAYVENNHVLRGMITSEVNAKRLSELSDLWMTKDLSQQTLLLYGNVSGLGFILNSDVCISTAWPSLESFSTDKFKTDITTLESSIDAHSVITPTVVIGAEEFESIVSPNSVKQEILKNFLDKYKYNVIYSNDMLFVMTAN